MLVDLLLARFLRVDTLSLLLSLANVTAHSDVLVFDMLEGLVTGSVAERLGGLLFLISIEFIPRNFLVTHYLCKK